MKLHLGCGSRIEPGWKNLDMDPPADLRHDIRLGLPFAAGSVDMIYCEHTLEHVTRAEAVALLAECVRVLRPGGVARFSTPDLQRLVANYLGARDTKRYPADETRSEAGMRIEGDPIRFYESVGWVPDTPCEMLNGGMRMWGHLYLYDQQELARVAGEAGFTLLGWRPYRETRVEGMIVEGRPFLGELIVELTK